MERLSVVDDIFLRTHRGLGTPIALQGLWRTADRVDPELLRQVHAALRVGPLGRRVVRPRVPGARRRWQPNTRAYPLEFAGTIAGANLLDWADRQGRDLDPEYGPGWRLSAVDLDDGGTVVSLTCSHALADGRGLVLAVEQALLSLGGPDVRHFDRFKSGRGRSDSARTGATNSPGQQRRSGRFGTRGAAAESIRYGVHPAPANAATAPRESDWADARRQWSTVLRGTARALRGGIPRWPAGGAPHDNTGSDSDAGKPRTPPDGAVTHSVTLQCPAADWELAAAAQGGTANSLFIALLAKLLWSSGFPRETIDASLPVDTRHEPRVDNDLAMTEIALDRSDTPATIREKARIAYERRMSSPGGLPEELLQVMPDRLAYALSKGAGERDILCSNIGTLPAALRALGPHRCIGVAARAIHPGLTADRLPRTRLSGYLCRIGDTYTLSIVSLDPARIGSSERLRDVVRAATTALWLPITLW